MNQLLPPLFLMRTLCVKCCLVMVLLCVMQPALAQSGNALITISSSPTSGCVGQPVTFTAVATNVGALPVYQWQVNGSNTGTNQNKFTSSLLANGDVVQCIVSWLGANGISKTNSNTLTMTVISPPTIVQHDMAVCPGSSVLLQADVSGAAYAKYKPVDFANQFNFNVSLNPFGRQFLNCPTGNVTFNGVPYIMYPWSDNFTGWSASSATGPDPRKLFFPVNEDGVVAINLLANTYFGLPGPASYVSVSFWGNGTEVYKKDLIGDQDIRDFNAAQFTNQINNTSTTNAWLSPNGQNRLDNVRIQMPTPSRIDSIVVNDHGGNGQRIFIIGATVEKTPVTLKWSTGEIAQSITVNPIQATTYTVMATNGVAACSGNSVTISMTTPLAPSVSISQSANNVCPGTPITFTATPTNGGNAPAYQWMVKNTKAGTNNSVFVSDSLANADVVTCVMASSAACITSPAVTSNPQTVTLLPLPVVDAGPDVIIHQGDETQLKATVTGNVLSVQWSPATGLDNASILRPVATPVVTTKYTLTVQNQNTCTAIDSLTIKVLPLDVSIPNAFSPNHDGVNDVWNIKHLDEFTGSTLKVYNRYGQQMYSSVGYAHPWNGTYNNKRLPAGTYYYIIDLKDGSAVRSGYVAILY